MITTHKILEEKSISISSVMIEEKKVIQHSESKRVGLSIKDEKDFLDIAEIKKNYPDALLITVEKLQRKKEDDLNGAYDIFCQLLQKKDVNALYELGRVLEDPNTTDNNPKEAIKWLKAAGELGHAEACALLGRIYAEGRSNVDISLSDACEWLNKAINKGVDKPENFLFLAMVFDRLNKPEEALKAVISAAEKNNSRAQLELCRRYQCGIGASADPIKARIYLDQAAKDKKDNDSDPAVLLAKALANIKYESIPSSTLKNLFVSYVDKVESVELDGGGNRTINCSLNDKKLSLVIPSEKYNQEMLTQYFNECLKEDSSNQNLGIILGMDVFDPETGNHEQAPFALIKSRVVDPELEIKENPKETTEDKPKLIITPAGHHTNNWLAVMGDIDRIMPTLLKYLNRDWKRDIADRNSGLEWLPQRLHLSLGKPSFGDLYVGKIGVGCSVWMYVILSTPPPTLRPEIHSVFPVVVAKSRKFILNVKQILEWHNRIEATMKAEVEYTTDEECKKVVSLMQSTPDVKTTPDAKAMLDVKTTPKPELPVFAIDYAARRKLWESKGPHEVFLSGIASCMIRNPEDSLNINARPSTDFRRQVTSDKEEPCSIVPGIAGPHNKTFPWSKYKDIRGIIPNEGPRKENQVTYVQGKCIRTIQLPGTIFGKSAYMVTIRIDEERKIDLDVWCLLKHMLDGRATIMPGEYMTVNAGAIPKPGDLVFADVWIHGTIATGLDPVLTVGTEIKPEVESPVTMDMESSESKNEQQRLALYSLFKDSSKKLSEIHTIEDLIKCKR